MTKRATTFTHTSDRDPLWVRLFAAVLTQAYRDLVFGDAHKARDALYWLATDDAQLYTEACRIEQHPLDVFGRPLNQLRKALAHGKQTNPQRGV